MGIGDRFARQGTAQLRAFVRMAEAGTLVTPVWNKSFREHKTVGSEPASVRAAAQAAVEALGWTHGYCVDADHITLKTVEGFLDSADFFTLDVTEYIGQAPDSAQLDAFLARYAGYVGVLEVPYLMGPLVVTQTLLRQVADRYWVATQAAGALYRYIAQRKPAGSFVIEVSMDEVAEPQSPLEVFFVLALLAEAGVPLRTIAPKFTGRFNKGVDYVGSANAFEQDLYGHLGCIALAVERFGLPPDLKLSIHTGSDKFSLYPLFHAACQRTGAGLHLKTAGTTWLEEAIGLAEAGGSGLALVKTLYAQALGRYTELVAPYAQVIDVDPQALPSAAAAQAWDDEAWVRALRHVPTDPLYNPSLRQFLHVSYKLAAELGPAYHAALTEHAEVIARNVTENIYSRHLLPLFGGLAESPLQLSPLTHPLRHEN